MDGLMRDLRFGAYAESFSRVRVPVELRKVAARKVDAHAMTFEKHVACAHQVNGQFVNFAGFEQLRTVHSIAVAGPQDAFTHIDGAAIGINIDEFGDKISIFGVGGGVKHDLHGTGNL